MATTNNNSEPVASFAVLMMLAKLDWKPFTAVDREEFADAGENAFIAREEDGTTYVRSECEGECGVELSIDKVNADGEPVTGYSMQAWSF